MRILVVDDEWPARERIKQLLNELEDCEVVGEAANGQQALQLSQQLQPDVVLLDVRMPGLSGIEVAQHFNSLDAPPAVVFATAYDEYAVDAFEAEAIGYLLKPVRKEKLARALRHAGRISTSRLRQLQQNSGNEQRRVHICARLGDNLRLIPVADISYFLAEQKFTTVRHHNGSELIDESLKDLSSEFADDFIRIHRNALVAEKAIEKIERDAQGQYKVWLRNLNEALPVSRRHATAVLRRVRGIKEQ
ncbi:MAG: LytTR family DNA-binding domain-containing protein [Steroidobacter sp.]